MVVLGRHDWPKDPNGNDVLPNWDISGGHTNESDVSAVDPPNATPKVARAKQRQVLEETLERQLVRR